MFRRKGRRRRFPSFYSLLRIQVCRPKCVMRLLVIVLNSILETAHLRTLILSFSSPRHKQLVVRWAIALLFWVGESPERRGLPSVANDPRREKRNRRSLGLKLTNRIVERHSCHSDALFLVKFSQATMRGSLRVSKITRFDEQTG